MLTVVGCDISSPFSLFFYFILFYLFLFIDKLSSLDFSFPFFKVSRCKETVPFLDRIGCPRPVKKATLLFHLDVATLADFLFLKTRRFCFFLHRVWLSTAPSKSFKQLGNGQSWIARFLCTFFLFPAPRMWTSKDVAIQTESLNYSNRFHQ